MEEKETTKKKSIEKIEVNVRETLGLSKDFSTEENLSNLKLQATEFVSALIGNDANSNEKQESIFSLANKEQQKVIDLGSNFSVKLKDLKKDEDGKKISTIVEALGDKFNKINPGNINWNTTPQKGFKSMLSKIPFFGDDITKYWSQYENVMVAINENMTMVNTLLDQKEQDIILINTRKDAFIESMAEYHKAILTGVFIKNALQEKIEVEEDKEKKRFMQENWLYPLNKRIITLQESYLSSFDSAISAELVARGHRELIMDLREKNKIAVIRLQTGVWLASELFDQKRMLESSKALKEANKNMADAVHKMLGTYQAEIQKEATDSFQEFDQWKAHMEGTIQMYGDAKDFRVEAINTLDQKIDDFDLLIKTADIKAKEIKDSDATQQKFLD